MVSLGQVKVRDNERKRLQSKKQERIGRISDAVRVILREIGEDVDREGLRDTPERYAKAMLYFTRGYQTNIREDVIKNAVFEEDHDEMVIVRDIEIYSLCEHHLVPFYGKPAHWVYSQQKSDWVK